MKTLHVGLCVDYKNEGLPFALKEASESYHELSTGEKDLEAKILRLIELHEFDLAFFQIQSPNIVKPFIFQKLKEKEIFTVNWSGDMRQGTPAWYFQTGSDLSLFTNYQDIDNLRQKGLKADFLQIGIDPKVFNRHGIKRNVPEIVFMGNHYGNQFPLGHQRLEMAKFMQMKFGNRFGVYGNYPGSIGNLNGNQLEESIVYNNAKIAINYSHFNSKGYTSDRLFRIMASGCACFSHNFEGGLSEFKDAVIFFNDLNELEYLINRYLSGKGTEYVETLGKRAFDLAHSKYTYKNMIEKLFTLVNKYK